MAQVCSLQAVRSPFAFQIPGCDPNLGWRLTERRANDKERQNSKQRALHLRLFRIISCLLCREKKRIRRASFTAAALGEDVVWGEAWESLWARE